MNVLLVKPEDIRVGDWYAACAGVVDRITWHPVVEITDNGFGAIEINCIGHRACVGKTAWVMIGREKSS